jgi:hypothetical protein
MAALGLALLAGCGASGDDNAGTSTGAAAPAEKQDSGESADGNTAPQAPGQPQAAGKSQAQPTITRAIIKTGSLTVEVGDVSAQRQKAITAIAGLDGQVASEDTGSNADGKITSANIVFKVPTKSFDAAIQRLSDDLGKRLQIRQESSDVTEQVVDVASRIESQRASLDRMRALMAKANTVGEIVSVESELTRREADLESLLAKQKNLALQTDLATLTLTLTEKGQPVAAADDRGFVGGLKGGWNAFTATFAALATAFGAALPFLVLLALIAVPLWRYRHRLRRQPAATGSGSGQ